MGSHLFAGEGVGGPSGGNVPELPKWTSQATQADILLAAALLREHTPTIWSDDPPLSDSQLAGLQTAEDQGELSDILWKEEPSFTDEQWITAKALDAERRAGLERRRQQVLRHLIDEFQSGGMRTFVQPVPGGAFEPLVEDRWLTREPVLRARFATGLINLRRPFDEKPADEWSEDPRFIFVSAIDPDRATGPRGPVFAGTIGYVSPYVKLMVVASQELGMTVESRLSTDLVTRKLEEIWTGWNFDPSELSERLKKAIATLLHEPSRKKGSSPNKFLDWIFWVGLQFESPIRTEAYVS